MSKTPSGVLKDAKIQAAFLLKDLNSGDPARAEAAALRFLAHPHFEGKTKEDVLADRPNIVRKHALLVIALEHQCASWEEFKRNAESGQALSTGTGQTLSSEPIQFRPYKDDSHPSYVSSYAGWLALEDAADEREISGCQCALVVGPDKSSLYDEEYASFLASNGGDVLTPQEVDFLRAHKGALVVQDNSTMRCHTFFFTSYDDLDHAWSNLKSWVRHAMVALTARSIFAASNDANEAATLSPTEIQSRLAELGGEFHVSPMKTGHLWIVNPYGEINVSSLAQVRKILQDAEEILLHAKVGARPNPQPWLWNRLGGSNATPEDLANAPFVPCYQVEYDPEFWGGNYDRAGSYSYVPAHQVRGDTTHAVGIAFREQTGHDPANIIHFSWDELVTQNGEIWDDSAHGDAESIIAAHEQSDEIDAIVYPDEMREQMGVEFDARPWFEQASDDEILALAGIGWGGNYESDWVARFFEDRDDEVQALFKLIDRKGLGYECHIDEDDAIRWVRIHRPHLVSKIPVFV